MKKSLLYVLLVLVLLLSAVFAVGAENAASEPDFQYSLTLNESIAINFKVARADIEGFEKIAFYKNEELVQTIDAVPAGTSEKVVFSFTELTPHEMGTEIKAVLTVNGEEYTKTASVLSYCNAILAGNYSNSLKTLVVDLLNYGAQTQNYVGGYSTLVNAELGEYASFATSADPSVSDITAQGDNVEGATVAWKGVGLNLKDSVTIRLRFAAENTEGLKVVISGPVSGEITDFEAAAGYDGQYYAYFSGLNPSQMRDAVTAQVYQGDTPVSKVLTYSIESYAAAAAENEVELTKAMMRYGDAVARWLTLNGLDSSVSANLPYVGSTVHEGDEIRFTIDVTNTSTAAATDVVVTQTLENVSDITAEGAAITDNTITWTLDSLAAGATQQLTFTVKADGSYTQAVQASCTVDGVSVDAAQLRIGSALSDIQKENLGYITDSVAENLKGTLTAANYLRKIYTDVLKFTGNASKALPGYSNFTADYFQLTDEAYKVKEDLSGLTADQSKIWNMLVYYGGDQFLPENNDRFISSESFDVAALEVGDYIMGWVDETEGFNFTTYQAVYMGVDAEGNYRFVNYQTAAVLKYTAEEFAAFMDAWHNVYVMRPALSYNVSETWNAYDVVVSTGRTGYNSVSAGETVTYEVTIANNMVKDIVGLAVSATTNYDSITAVTETVEGENSVWSVDIAGGETATIKYIVQVKEELPEESKDKKSLVNTISVDGVEYIISNRFSFALNSAVEDALLSNTTVLSKIAHARAILGQAWRGEDYTSSEIPSYTAIVGDGNYPITKNSDGKYERNASQAGEKWDQYIAVWGGSNTQGEASDAQYLAGAFNIDYLQPGDLLEIDGAYRLYLGKQLAEDAESYTYHFADSTGANNQYTAETVSTVLPSSTTGCFIVVRTAYYLKPTNTASTGE